MLSLDDPKTGKTIVFEQDFSKIQDVDEKVWKFNDGPVYNDEKQRYTKKPARNVWIEDGALTIEARKVGSDITSGRLESHQSWKYGYFEIVAKVPTGKGTWPAIWMLSDRLRATDPAKRLGWPKCGEIDIMEHVGFDPDRFHFNVHSDKYNHTKGNPRGANVAVTAGPSKFRTFALDWQPKVMRFLMDGKECFKVEKTEETLEAWPFDDPYYFILNLAIGGTWGGQQGIDDAIFPSQFKIKSVRVYQ